MLSVVVRLLDRTASPERLAGEVELVRTGERHRFRDADELVEVLVRLRVDERSPG
mgnify:CR=1 FL=1|jgi:hypothetical protein